MVGGSPLWGHAMRLCVYAFYFYREERQEKKNAVGRQQFYVLLFFSFVCVRGLYKEKNVTWVGHAALVDDDSRRLLFSVFPLDSFPSAVGLNHHKAVRIASKVFHFFRIWEFKKKYRAVKIFGGMSHQSVDHSNSKLID